jgi:hypothetical protein
MVSADDSDVDQLQEDELVVDEVVVSRKIIIIILLTSLPATEGASNSKKGQEHCLGNPFTQAERTFTAISQDHQATCGALAAESSSWTRCRGGR